MHADVKIACMQTPVDTTIIFIDTHAGYSVKIARKQIKNVLVGLKLGWGQFLKKVDQGCILTS